VLQFINKHHVLARVYLTSTQAKDLTPPLQTLPWKERLITLATNYNLNYTNGSCLGLTFLLQLINTVTWCRFPALPDFLSSSGSGTGSTQPREDNWRATWMKSSGSSLENWDSWPCGIRHADHTTPLYLQKLGTKIRRQVAVLNRYSSLLD
jgi:hypothetical protein